MKKKKDRSTYGVPLYGAVWPPGDYVILGGGGGKASSGIVNKYALLPPSWNTEEENEELGTGRSEIIGQGFVTES